jgi:hypothetical protein
MASRGRSGTRPPEPCGHGVLGLAHVRFLELPIPAWRPDQSLPAGSNGIRIGVGIWSNVLSRWEIDNL